MHNFLPFAVLNYTFEADIRKSNVRLPPRVGFLGVPRGKLELPGQEMEICTDIKLRLLVLFFSCVTRPIIWFTDKDDYDRFSCSGISKTGYTLSPSQLLCLWGVPLNGPVSMLRPYWTAFSPITMSQRYTNLDNLT